MPVLRFSIVMNDLQFCVFYLYIISLIALFNCWRRIFTSCVRRRVEFNYNL